MNCRITERVVKALKPPASGNRIIYDDQLAGFGVRITAKSVISFVLNYWVNGRERRYTLGRYPELTATAARSEAIQLRDMIRHGGDPVADKERRRAAPTVADLAKDYLQRYARLHKRPWSVKNDEYMLRKVIVPKLGRLQVANVRRRDVEDVH